MTTNPGMIDIDLAAMSKQNGLPVAECGVLVVKFLVAKSLASNEPIKIRLAVTKEGVK